MLFIIKIFSLFQNLFLSKTSYSVENKFNNWADEIWEKSKSKYKFIAVRNSEELNVMYPKEDLRLKRLKIFINDICIGWAVVIHNKHEKHKQFGKINLGSIVDCLALPGYEKYVINCSTKYLEKNCVDLIVSNQSHISWRKSLIRCLYFKGPSNFALATSKNLTKEILKISKKFDNIHINRGDGDGPINL